MPSAVIFDVDGTLIDSNDLHAQCWVETFQNFGVELAFETVRGQIGKGGDQLKPALLPAELVKQEGEAMDEFRRELFTSSYLSLVKPFEGVPDLFEKIRAGGAVITLASSGESGEVEQHIKLLGVSEYIEAATTSDDAEHSKPAPDIFSAAMRRLPVECRDDVIVVGDTPYDAEAAGQAGLRTIGLLCGGFSRGDLLDAGCVAVFDDPQDLLARYDRSPPGSH